MPNSHYHAANGPALHAMVRKVWGTFGRDPELQAAVMRLIGHGSDRTDLSLAQPRRGPFPLGGRARSSTLTCTRHLWLRLHLTRAR